MKNIKDTTLYQEALYFATACHQGQDRKYTHDPYIVHPVEVANTVIATGGTLEMAMGALLHDVVEDCEVENKQIVELFGKNVGRIVDDLTDKFTKEEYPQHNRKARKLMEAERLGNCPADSQTIKVIDLINNSVSIIEHDRHFRKVFVKEMGTLLQYLTKADPKLLAEAQQIVDNFNKEA